MSKRGRTLSWRTGGLVLLGYLALSVLLLGRGTLGHLDSHCLCTASADPTQFVWSMVWWPHAIGHGSNPILTHAIWAPEPFDLAAATSVPLAAVVATPVTLTLGPLASYNLLILFSPVLAGFFTFRLCYYLTGRTAASLVGGFMFGFSSFMFAGMTSHLHMTLVFLIPLAIHLALRYADEAIGRRRFVVSIAAVIAAQALLSTEVLLTSLLFAAITLLAAFLVSGAEGRGRVRRLTIATLFGGVIASAVISPFLYYALFYGPSLELVSGSRISMDALNPLVPTGVTRIGRSEFAAVAGTFPGNYAESGGYLGIAIVLLAGWWLVSTWRRTATRVMIIVLVCAVVGSLGTHLYISGQSTIVLPWRLVENLPLLDQVIPVRLAMFTALVVAVAVSMALASAAGTAWLRWGLALVGVVMLLPNGGSWLLQSDPPEPSFFTTDQYKRYIHHNETVLAIPYSQTGFSLLWQARTDMWFRMAGGYLGQQPPEEYLEEPAVLQLLSNSTETQTPCYLKSFIERRHVGAVVVESASPEPWGAVLAQLGLRSQTVGGVDFYPVPQSLLAPANCT